MPRPSAFKPEYNKQAEKLSKLGATDVEMADFFGITEKTLNNWKKSKPEFFQSLKRGKVLADSQVADRLYQRAMGFEHDSEEIKVIGNKVVRVATRKIYPPDTTAAIFWLKNRRKTEWRDRQDHEHSGKDGEAIEQNLSITYMPEPLKDDYFKQQPNTPSQ